MLEVNQAARMEFKMELGATTEKVEVAGQAPLIDPSSASIGQVVDNRSISNLPLNERNSWSLVFLAPGVEGSVGDSRVQQRQHLDQWRPARQRRNPGGRHALPPPRFPIHPGLHGFALGRRGAKFKVQTDNYSAEFGRSGSGVINLIYKSGTNSLHGSAFEFLRNSDMDANNFSPTATACR